MTSSAAVSPTLFQLATPRRLVEALHRAGYSKCSDAFLPVSNERPNYQFVESDVTGTDGGGFEIWPTLRPEHADFKGCIGFACRIHEGEILDWGILDTTDGGEWHEFGVDGPAFHLDAYRVRLSDLGALVDEFIAGLKQKEVRS